MLVDQRYDMKYPKLHPTNKNTFVLLEEYRCLDVVVPKGYETNGADIPRLFWSWVPPFKPKYLPAVVVHDYLCELKEYNKADKYFKDILEEIEDSLMTRTMSRAVKFYTRWIR